MSAPRGEATSPWVLALVFVVAWLFRFLSTASLPNDHFMHLAWANQVLGGELPVRDFVDPGMPLTYLTSAAAQLLFGRGAWTEAALSITLLAAGAALTCHLAARASGSVLVGIAAAMVQVVIAPRLYAAPKILLPLWAVWAFWRYADRPTGRRLLGLVACTVTAFLVRHDHGVYIGTAATVLLVVVHWPRGIARVAGYSALVVLFLLPFLAYVQMNGGLFGYVRAGVAFSRAEYTGRRVARWPRFDLSVREPAAPEVNLRWASTVDAATRARVEAEHGLANATLLRERTWRYRLRDPSAANVRALINRQEVEDTAGIDRARSRVLGVDDTMFARIGRTADERGARWVTALLKRENAVGWTYLLYSWVPLVVLLMLGVAWARPSWGLDTGLLPRSVAAASAVLSVATNEGFLRDPLDVRLADASAVTLVLAAWLGWQFRGAVPTGVQAASPRPLAVWPRRVVTAIVVAAAAATLASAAELGGLHRAIEETRVSEGPRAVASRASRVIGDLNTRPPIDGWIATGDERRELKELTRYIRECTQPEDRLLVTWFAPEVYFYAERRFAAGLAFFYPGFFASPDQEQLALTRLQGQRVPIVLADVARSGESFAGDHPLLAAHLADRYVLAGEVAAADGGRYRVLVDRRAVPVRALPHWSLPCFR